MASVAQLNRLGNSALRRPAVPAILRPLFIRFPWQIRTRLDERGSPGATGFGWRRRESDCWDCWRSRRCCEPSPPGYGTHQQLGLPPCTFWVLFGRPCPTCGMTTAWAHLMRGEWLDACRANAGGALLGLLAMVAAPWLLGSADSRPIGWALAPSERAAAWISAIRFVGNNDRLGLPPAGPHDHTPLPSTSDTRCCDESSLFSTRNHAHGDVADRGCCRPSAARSCCSPRCTCSRGRTSTPISRN